MGLFSSQPQRFIDTVTDILATLLYTSFVIFAEDAKGVYSMIALIFAIFFINFARSPGNFKLHLGIFHYYIISLALFSYLSALWAIRPDLAFEKGTTLMSILVLFSILYSIYYHSSIERLLKIIMWSGFILSIYTISFYGLDQLQIILNSGRRLNNEFANVNEIGMACSTSVLIAVYFFKKNKKIIDIVFCVPAIMIVAGTGSRKALVMLILGLIFIFLHQQNKSNGFKRYFKLIFAIAITCIVVYSILQLDIFAGSLERIDGLIASITGKGEIDHSTYLRDIYRTVGFKQFNDTPFLGIGIGNARLLAIAATGDNCYLHCNYAELAASGGMVGLILYYWIYIPIIRKEFLSLRTNNLSSIILLLTLIHLVMDYGCVTYYTKSTFFFMLIVLLHYNRLKETPHNNQTIKPHAHSFSH